mmetsp:Transcript_41011/g.82532  ORF Transcript_41011/g.82532 Transcript_41011/m.82532 type:complete len:245 (+) Transcript_41011:40-774(+)
MKLKKEAYSSSNIFSKVRIIKIFERTSLLLKIYRSGKLPKLIKVLPFLKNFEEFLWLLRPDSWSPQALSVITRLFINNLDNLQIGRFFSQIIVPRLQEVIFQRKNISVHIFLSLKISTIRSKSFISFILIPLFKGENCTAKEAIIFGSIISRFHFSQGNFLWALMNLVKNPCNSPRLILIRAFLSKGKPLPYRALDLLIDFFLQNSNNRKNSTYKKCFLVFLKNYYCFISNEDKKRILRINVSN